MNHPLRLYKLWSEVLEKCLRSVLPALHEYPNLVSNFHVRLLTNLCSPPEQLNPLLASSANCTYVHIYTENATYIYKPKFSLQRGEVVNYLNYTRFF